MADTNLTQAEAQALIAMEKHRVDDKEWRFSLPGDRLSIPLVSADKRERFILDATRFQKNYESDVSESGSTDNRTDAP